jgi:hypothetical protein
VSPSGALPDRKTNWPGAGAYAGVIRWLTIILTSVRLHLANRTAAGSSAATRSPGAVVPADRVARFSTPSRARARPRFARPRWCPIWWSRARCMCCPSPASPVLPKGQCLRCQCAGGLERDGGEPHRRLGFLLHETEDGGDRSRIFSSLTSLILIIALAGRLAQV